MSNKKYYRKYKRIVLLNHNFIHNFHRRLLIDINCYLVDKDLNIFGICMYCYDFISSIFNISYLIFI